MSIHKKTSSSYHQISVSSPPTMSTYSTWATRCWMSIKPILTISTSKRKPFWLKVTAPVTNKNASASSSAKSSIKPTSLSANKANTFTSETSWNEWYLLILYQTFQKISLTSVPRSLLLNETRKDCEVIVGLREGGIISLNAIEPEDRSKYEGIVNNSIDCLHQIKGKNWIMAGHPNALAFYSSEWYFWIDFPIFYFSIRIYWYGIQ